MSEALELAQKLRSEGEKFAAFFGALTDDQWQEEVYTEGSVWTVRSILAHLMTSERAFMRVFESVRQGGTGVPEDFVIDRYNARQQEKTRGLPPAQLLEQYRNVRAEMVAWVSGISAADLERSGRHPFLGIATLRDMIKMIYIHNQTHYRDMRKALRT
jgi:uncharacterized protein (TIGR03083 family)